jgi:hypothetical protein
MSKVTFRPFERADIPALTELTKYVFEGNDYLANQAEELLADPSIVFNVVQTPACAFAGVTLTQLIDNKKTAFLFGIRIASALRGQKLGLAALRLQTQRAWEMGVERIRWTRNGSDPATGRMAEDGGYKELMRHGLIRIQKDLSGFFTTLKTLPVTKHVLREMSVAELQTVWQNCSEAEREELCHCQTVILPAWKLALVAHLGPGYRVMGEFSETGQLLAFSVRGEGRNSALGTLRSLYLSGSSR